MPRNETTDRAARTTAGPETPPSVLTWQGSTLWFAVTGREPKELALSQLDGALPIPKGELTDRVDELTRGRPIALVCRSGPRCADAVRTPLHLGFQRVRNLWGGIAP